MDWDEIPASHQYVKPERFRVYQFSEGQQEYPDFVHDVTPCPCGAGHTPFVWDRDRVVPLDTGDWVVLNEEDEMRVYSDADFREYFEEIS